MGPGLPGQRAVTVRRRPRVRRAAVGAGARHDPHRRRARHHRHVRADWPTGEIKAVLDHLHQSRCHRGQSADRDRRPGSRRTGHHPGRLPRHRHQPLRRHRAARHAVGRVRRRDGQLRAQPHAAAAVDPAARRGPAGLGADLPGRRAPRASATQFDLQVQRGDLRRDPPVLTIRETGYDLRGVELRAAARDAAAVAVPAGRRTERPRTRSATSTTGSARTCSSTTTGTDPGWPSPHRRGARCSIARPHMDAAELPDDDYPFVLNTGRLQHQWHTMTKTGKVAKLNKLNPGPFVEIHPDDAAALGHRRRPAGRDRPRAAAARCCRRWSPTGCGPATASCRSTGTTSTAST